VRVHVRAKHTLSYRAGGAVRAGAAHGRGGGRARGRRGGGGRGGHQHLAGSHVRGEPGTHTHTHIHTHAHAHTYTRGGRPVRELRCAGGSEACTMGSGCSAWGVLGMGRRLSTHCCNCVRVFGMVCVCVCVWHATQVFGSYATGLYVPTSDIDLVILNSSVGNVQVCACVCACASACECPWVTRLWGAWKGLPLDPCRRPSAHPRACAPQPAALQAGLRALASKLTAKQLVQNVQVGRPALRQPAEACRQRVTSLHPTCLSRQARPGVALPLSLLAAMSHATAKRPPRPHLAAIITGHCEGPHGPISAQHRVPAERVKAASASTGHRQGARAHHQVRDLGLWQPGLRRVLRRREWAAGAAVLASSRWT
jgi:hypothetical protein